MALEDKVPMRGVWLTSDAVQGAKTQLRSRFKQFNACGQSRGGAWDS